MVNFVIIFMNSKEGNTAKFQTTCREAVWGVVVGRGGGRGGGSEGCRSEVFMNKKSQIRGCYNFIPTKQETV